MIAIRHHRLPSPRLVRHSRRRARRREPRNQRTDAGRVALARQVAVQASRGLHPTRGELLAALQQAVR